MRRRWVVTAVVLGLIAVLGLASALAMVAARGNDGAPGRGGQPFAGDDSGWMGHGMGAGWMMDSDGFGHCMEGVLSDEDAALMYEHMEAIRAGEPDSLDDATAHRIWDEMLQSGWMMGGAWMMDEDHMGSHMAGILSQEDIDLMFEHMEGVWSGDDPLDDTTAHALMDRMMSAMWDADWDGEDMPGRPGIEDMPGGPGPGMGGGYGMGGGHGMGGGMWGRD